MNIEVMAYTMGAAGFTLLGLMAGWFAKGRDGLLRGGLAAGLCVMIATVSHLAQLGQGKGMIAAYVLLILIAYKKEEPKRNSRERVLDMVKGFVYGAPIAFLFITSFSLFSAGYLPYRDPVDGLPLLKFFSSIGLGCVVTLCAVLAHAVLPKTGRAFKLFTAQVLLTAFVTGLYLSTVSFWYTELRDFSEIDFVRFTDQGKLLYQVDQRQGGAELDRICRLNPENGEKESFTGSWSELREGKHMVDLCGDWAALKTGLGNLKSGELVPYQGVGGRARVTFLPEFGGHLVFSNGCLRWEHEGRVINIAECMRFRGVTDTRALYFRKGEGSFAFNFQTMTETKLSKEFVRAYNSEWAIVEEDGWVQAIALDGSGSRKVYKKQAGRDREFELSPFDDRLLMFEMDALYHEDRSPEVVMGINLRRELQQEMDVPGDEFDGRQLTWLPNGSLCLVNDYGKVYLADGLHKAWKELDFQAASAPSVNPWKEEFVVRTLSNSLLIVNFEGDILRTYTREELI